MTTDAVGGVWTYSLELANGLRRRGSSVVLAVIGPPPTQQQEDEAALAGIAACVPIGPGLEWAQGQWSDVDRAGARLLELADDVRPDLVHLNGYVHADLPWRAPTVVVGHSDVRSWWRAVHGTPAPSSWNEYSRRVRRGLAAADAVVVPTRAVGEDLQREFGSHDSIVIHNGRSGDCLHAEPKQPLIVSAGRLWDEAKNVRALATVAPGVPWPIHVAGDHHPHSGDTGGNRELDGLEWLGRLHSDDLARWLARAAIYAAPARYEPFGLAVLEAALCGCALVLGDVPSLREIWGDAALYADPADTRMLQRRLYNLIEDDTRRAELGVAARRRARAFTIDRMVTAYISLYARLERTSAGAESVGSRAAGARTP